MLTNDPETPKAKRSLCCKLLLFLIILIFVFAGGIYWYVSRSTDAAITTPIARILDPRPLDAYTFDALSQREPEVSPITLEQTLSEEDTFTSQLFSFTTEGKRVTGQINLPANYQATRSPAIIMLRGWVDPDNYQTGVGTKAAAAVFAQHGYITLAPDFLGYGGSDPEDNDSFAARLKRPVTLIDLLASVNQLPYVDSTNIFLWAHSNGGQIALSVLEITNFPYPTALWAPVSKPFPYSIIYYTDESEDRGKALRKALAKFEATYDVDLYSIDRYFDRITAPVQIHQGTADDSVPASWSNDLVDVLKATKKIQEASGASALDYTYYTYPGADHNLRPGWDTAIARDLQFFSEYTK